MKITRLSTAGAALLLLGAAPQRFPRPDRPVATVVSDEWSDETSRDNAR